MTKKCMTLVALMAASLTATVSWDVTTCSLAEVSNVSEEVSVTNFAAFLFFHVTNQPFNVTSSLLPHVGACSRFGA
jgi:hypothetical protein